MRGAPVSLERIAQFVRSAPRQPLGILAGTCLAQPAGGAQEAPDPEAAMQPVQAHPDPRTRATAILLFWMGIVLMGMVFVA
jgi:hypothetical protein